MKDRGLVVGDRILAMSADTHADWCAAYGHVGSVRAVAGSAVGQLHLREGKPRDDAFAIRSAGPWLAVAVADGVGSRSLSRVGSSFAVEGLCEQLLREVIATPPASPQPSPDQPLPVADTPDESIEKTLKGEASVAPVLDLPSLPSVAASDGPSGTLTWWRGGNALTPLGRIIGSTTEGEEVARISFERTRQGLERYAQGRGLRLGELSCTLLGLLLDTSSGLLILGQIGDGIAAALNRVDGAVTLIEPPETGSPTDTYVFTQTDWEKHLAVRCLLPEQTENLLTLFLMTDGVSEDCTHPPPPDIFQRWVRDIDREMRQDGPLPNGAVRLVNWLASYQAPTSFDDRTLAVILRPEPTAPGGVAP
jgi:hypothetical protein